MTSLERGGIMQSRLEKLYRIFSGKRIMVIGIGISNTPVIKKLAEMGAAVTVCDRRTREGIGESADEFEAMGIDLRLGEDYLDRLDCDIIIRTPGMYYNSPELVEARARGIAVTSEMELFFELCPCRIFAITGSDGKTTTSSIIASMLETTGEKVYLGGNIGKALFPLIEVMEPDDYAVVELSSFQLISMRQGPDVAVITNISPNHLDVHSDMDEYIAAKKNIFLHQNAFSRTVVNLDNPLTQGFSKEIRGECLYFSRKNEVEGGSYVKDNKIYFKDRRSGFDTEVMDINDINLPGEHNLENFLAAVSAVWGFVDIKGMKKTAKTFSGVEHRIEFVSEHNGVRWYNDSIATSPTRTIAGLNAFERKIILIAGGYDKKVSYDPIAPHICQKVKYLILLGQTADKIEQAVRSCSGYQSGEPEIIRVNNLREAVLAADSKAAFGDIVILSPASASFDMYANFEQRGIEFKKLVKSLAGENR